MSGSAAALAGEGLLVEAEAWADMDRFGLHRGHFLKMPHPYNRESWPNIQVFNGPETNNAFYISDLTEGSAGKGGKNRNGLFDGPKTARKGRGDSGLRGKVAGPQPIPETSLSKPNGAKAIWPTIIRRSYNAEYNACFSGIRGDDEKLPRPG